MLTCVLGVTMRAHGCIGGGGTLAWTAAGSLLMVITVCSVLCHPVRTFQNIFFRVKMVLWYQLVECVGFSLDGVSQGCGMGFTFGPTKKSQGGGGPSWRYGLALSLRDRNDCVQHGLTATSAAPIVTLAAGLSYRFSVAGFSAGSTCRAAYRENMRSRTNDLVRLRPGDFPQCSACLSLRGAKARRWWDDTSSSWLFRYRGLHLLGLAVIGGAVCG